MGRYRVFSASHLYISFQMYHIYRSFKRQGLLLKPDQFDLRVQKTIQIIEPVCYTVQFCGCACARVCACACVCVCVERLKLDISLVSGYPYMFGIIHTSQYAGFEIDALL